MKPAGRWRRSPKPLGRQRQVRRGEGAKRGAGGWRPGGIRLRRQEPLAEGATAEVFQFLFVKFLAGFLDFSRRFFDRLLAPDALVLFKKTHAFQTDGLCKHRNLPKGYQHLCQIRSSPAAPTVSGARLAGTIHVFLSLSAGTWLPTAGDRPVVWKKKSCPGGPSACRPVATSVQAARIFAAQRGRRRFPRRFFPHG